MRLLGVLSSDSLVARCLGMVLHCLQENRKDLVDQVKSFAVVELIISTQKSHHFVVNVVVAQKLHRRKDVYLLAGVIRKGGLLFDFWFCLFCHPNTILDPLSDSISIRGVA